ncbi:MAG: ankyrin repeat domain-containing protein [Candidatus Latescibacteria bacterium]|nr:ankyrin repeat domain-containing protein [Candidatus Latescibacterota bacterium]
MSVSGRRLNFLAALASAAFMLATEASARDLDEQMADAIRAHNFDKVEYLIHRGGTVPTSQSGLLLQLAAGGDRLALVRALVSSGTDLESYGPGALVVAADGGYVDIVEALIEGGVDVDARADDGRTAAVAAAEKGHMPILVRLYLGDADLEAASEDGRTPLAIAAGRGNG